MATLATKPYLVASLNVMLAAQEDDEQVFTEDEIIEILSAMAETDAMASSPQITEPVHWHNGPSRPI